MSQAVRQVTPSNLILSTAENLATKLGMIMLSITRTTIKIKSIPTNKLMLEKEKYKKPSDILNCRRSLNQILFVQFIKPQSRPKSTKQN